MHLDNDGKVGIGTTSPSHPISVDVGSTTNTPPLYLKSASKYVTIGAHNTSHCHFHTDASNTYGFWFNTGMEISGALTKASGSLRIGYVRKVYDNLDLSQDSPSFGVDLSWKLNQKTGVSITLDRSFAPSPQDQSIQSSSLEVSLDHRLNERLSGDLYVSWSSSDFTTGAGALANSRNLDMFTFGGGLRKQISKHFTGGTGYSFSGANQSVGDDFNRHVLYFEVEGRY